MDMVLVWPFIHALLYSYASVVATFGVCYWIFKFFVWLLKI
jgi:hypothetical protein